MIYLYSESIIKWTQHLYQKSKIILANELSIKVNRTRFEYAGFTYPIKVVAYRNDSDSHHTLGRFNSDLLQIEINYDLTRFLDDKILLNILRHELAHYLCFILYGRSIRDHGTEYRQFCRQHGWDKEIYEAKLDIRQIQTPQQKLKKYQKLIELSKSSNIHEASLALEKAQSLASEYQLDQYSEENHDQLEFSLIHLDQAKKTPHVWKCISSILSEFSLIPSYHYFKNGVYFDVFSYSDESNMAKELFHYLTLTIDNLWLQAKKESGLKGLKQKNSFINGVEKGILYALRKNKQNLHSQALMLKNHYLVQMHTQFQGKARYYRSQNQTDVSARNLGFQMGQKQNLNLKKHYHLT